MTAPAADTDLLGALDRLRERLAEAPLTLEVPGAARARERRQQVVGQLTDYVLPRLRRLDAPLLAVVGGSTGAGKSTLVNSVVGARVSEPGVLRPTTRSPVLVHSPDDAGWFAGDRLLPGLPRTTGDEAEPGSIRLVATPSLPAGLALLDAPDIDSVVTENRVLAAELLAAADLWLFVTSAARYADAVPWGFLRSAAERSAAVAVVLDRVSTAATAEVRGHLAEMMADRGLGSAPLFTVEEMTLDPAGLVPAEGVAAIRGWLHDLAADSAARSGVVRQTLDGAVAGIAREVPVFAEAVQAQLDVVDRLRTDAGRAYSDSATAVDAATHDGTLLRGEVLARWQEFVGTGELLRGLEQRVGRLRDRVVAAVRGAPAPAERVTAAVESGLETLIVEHAEAAAERAEASWRATSAGRALLRGHEQLGRASSDVRTRAARTVRDWQGGVLELVRREGADRRSRARFLAFGVNGLGVALMVVVFVHTAGLSGLEVATAGGTAAVAQKVLEAVFGDQAVRRLAAQARADLAERVEGVLADELGRYLDLLDALDLDPRAPITLLETAAEVDGAHRRDGPVPG